MDLPPPLRSEDPSDEPGWWLASDWNCFPPEGASASLPPIHWYAPLFGAESPPVAPSCSLWEPTAVPDRGADEATRALFPPALDWETVETRPREASRRSGGRRVRLGVHIAAAAPLMLLIAAICTVYALE